MYLALSSCVAVCHFPPPHYKCHSEREKLHLADAVNILPMSPWIPFSISDTFSSQVCFLSSKSQHLQLFAKGLPSGSQNLLCCLLHRAGSAWEFTRAWTAFNNDQLVQRYKYLSSLASGGDDAGGDLHHLSCLLQDWPFVGLHLTSFLLCPAYPSPLSFSWVL